MLIKNLYYHVVVIEIFFAFVFAIITKFEMIF